MTTGVGRKRDDSGGRWTTYERVRPPTCSVPLTSDPAGWGDGDGFGVTADVPADPAHAQVASATARARSDLELHNFGKALFELP
jgi:hypothetical protein